jgi:hypothetical protein
MKLLKHHKKDFLILLRSIFLKHPFKTKIQNNLNGIIYSEINDRHYWKAEYTDEKNHQTLACIF